MSKQLPVIVVKVGGSLLLSRQAMDEFWQSVGRLTEKHQLVIVHGAGPQTTALSQKLGTPVRQVAGRRVTGDEELRNLLWAGRGELNSQLVASGFAQGISTVGLSGVDGGILQVDKRPPWKIDGQQVDFGWVGDVSCCDPSLPQALLEMQSVPVLASLGVDQQGQIYNVNADTVAAHLSMALATTGPRAVELQILTDSGGVLEQDQVLADLKRSTFASAVAAGWIEGGMRVKLDAGFLALAGGVKRVFINSSSGLLQATGGTQLL
jgi:acetylglutamate kinase